MKSHLMLPARKGIMLVAPKLFKFKHAWDGRSSLEKDENLKVFCWQLALCAFMRSKQCITNNNILIFALQSGHCSQSHVNLRLKSFFHLADARIWNWWTATSSTVSPMYMYSVWNNSKFINERIDSTSITSSYLSYVTNKRRSGASRWCFTGRQFHQLLACDAEHLTIISIEKW